MATPQDLFDSHHQHGTDRGHSAPVFDPKHKPTGLKEAALADWNSRLVVGKETVNDGTRLPTKPL